MARVRKHTSRDINDHIVDKAKVTEIGAKDAPVENVNWDVTKGEVHSTTQLTDDTGSGGAVLIRSFDFKANPEAFKDRLPTEQELFNAHLRQIEIVLLQDGLKVFTDVKPRLKISKSKTHYRITIGAEPMRGFLLHERPKKLTELV